MLGCICMFARGISCPHLPSGCCTPRHGLHLLNSAGLGMLFSVAFFRRMRWPPTVPPYPTRISSCRIFAAYCCSPMLHGDLDPHGFWATKPAEHTAANVMDETNCLECRDVYGAQHPQPRAPHTSSQQPCWVAVCNLEQLETDFTLNTPPPYLLCSSTHCAPQMISTAATQQRASRIQRQCTVV